jgi:hypothetical protein
LSYIVNAYEVELCKERTDFTDMIMRLKFDNDDSEYLLRDLVMYALLLSEISETKISDGDLEFLERLT